MTKEEIEALIEAEVGRRMATMTAQFGHDLADHFATKNDIIEAIRQRDEDEKTATEAFFQEAHDLLEKEKDLPEDHPLYFFVEMLDDMMDMRIRMVEIAMYILSTERTGTPDGGSPMDTALKRTHLKVFSIEQCRVRLRKDLKMMERIVGGEPDWDPEVVRDIEETLIKRTREEKQRFS